MGAVGGQEELSLGGPSGFQRKLCPPGSRGSRWLQSSDSWQTNPRPWTESSSGGTSNSRYWVAYLGNIPCPGSSHTGTMSCRFVPWMCLPTSVPAWLTAQRPTLVSGQPHPAQLWHVLPASGSSLSLAYMRPSWESWSPEKAASLPVEKVTGQGLAGNFSQLCMVLFHFCSPEWGCTSRWRDRTQHLEQIGWVTCVAVHGADDWKAKVVCKIFFCPSLVLRMSAQLHVHSCGCRYVTLASNPEVLCSIILCRAQDTGEIHFAILMCISVT